MDPEISARGYLIHYPHTVTVDPAKVTEEDCCDDEGNPTGKKHYSAEPDSFVIEVNYSNEILLPAWADRSSYETSCPTAVAEWDIFHGDVKIHERLHYNFAKIWLTESKIKSYFPGTLSTVKSSCFDPDKQDEVSAAQQEIIDSIKPQVKTILDKIDADEDLADNTHTQHPAGTTVIDPNEDCSNPKKMKKFKTILIQFTLLIFLSTGLAYTENREHEEISSIPRIEKLLAELKLDAKFKKGADGQLFLEVGISNTSDEVIKLETLSFKRARIDLMLRNEEKMAFPRLVSLVLQQDYVLEATIDKVPVDLSRLAVLQLPLRSSVRLTFDWNKILASMKRDLGKARISDQSDLGKSIIKAKIGFDELVDVQQASGKREHGGLDSQWLAFEM